MAGKQEPKRYFIINPAGAVHEVDREHARWRLKQPGFRMADQAEVDAYLKQPVQRADRPIATPFEATTDLPEPDLGDAE